MSSGSTSVPPMPARYPCTFGGAVLLIKAAFTSAQKIPSRPKEIFRSNTATRGVPFSTRRTASVGKGLKTLSRHSPSLTPRSLKSESATRAVELMVAVVTKTISASSVSTASTRP